MNKEFQGDVSQQAACYLKLIVNEQWDDESANAGVPDSQKPFNIYNKENLGSMNNQVRQADSISQADR